MRWKRRRIEDRSRVDITKKVRSGVDRA